MGVLAMYTNEDWLKVGIVLAGIGVVLTLLYIIAQLGGVPPWEPLT